MEIWLILLKMLGPQRAGWMWAEFTTKLGRMGCLCSVRSPRSKHLQQNESYFHNLHINWVWMGYVTSVELFMDLKPRIYEVWILVRYGNLETWIDLPRLYPPRFYQPRYNLGRFYLPRYYPSWFYPGSKNNTTDY